MTISARLISADETQLVAIIDGVEWSGIRCHRDGQTIVADGDGQIPDAVKKWIASGGVPTPYAAPAPTQADYTNAIKATLESTATARGYDSAISIATYVLSVDPAWKAEADAFVAWRDAVWVYAFTELAKVQAGQRTQPTPSAFVQELPQIAWPS